VLIKTGKPVSTKLIDLLADSTKGIMAHYILSNIWCKKKLLSTSSYFTADKVQVYNYNGLTFYQFQNKSLSAKPTDLVVNKENWIKYLQSYR
jgi:hypothetical protein